MKKFLIAFLLLCASPLMAQQPQYGGIISNHPVTTKQVLGIELTWLGLRNAGTTTVVVRFQETCDNGTVIAYPNPLANFQANDAQTSLVAQTAFSGTGVYFPCNGWLNWAGWIITSGTMTPGELTVQLQIMNQLPSGWNIAQPPPTGSATVQIGISNTIEEALCSGEGVLGYPVTWPSCQPYMTQPRMGSGSIQNIAVAQPASATNWAVGGAYPWNGNVNIQIVNITFSLTTSATAGNRYVCVQFLTGGLAGTVVGGPFCSVYAQPASTTVTYNFSSGIGGNTNCSLIGGTQTATKCASLPVPLPLYWEANGAVDNISVASIVLNDAATPANGFQTGDQLSAANLRVRVWHAND